MEGLSVGSKFAEDFGGVIGIDLGTTYSCVAVWLESEQRTEVRHDCERAQGTSVGQLPRCAGGRGCAYARGRERACVVFRQILRDGGWVFLKKVFFLKNHLSSVFFVQDANILKDGFSSLVKQNKKGKICAVFCFAGKRKILFIYL